MTGQTTTPDLPHDPYMDAVDNALIDAKLGMSDGLTSVGDDYDDQGAAILSAVILWAAGDTALNDAKLPDGLLRHWNCEAGWEYAPLRADGSNEAPLRHTFLDV